MTTKASMMAWCPSQDHISPVRRSRWAWALVLIFLVPLHGSRAINIQARYDHAKQLCLQGSVERCQIEADREFKLLRASNPQWASRFNLLEAQSMIQRGMYDDTLR